MRQVLLGVPSGRGTEVVETVGERAHSAPSVIRARTDQDDRDLVLVHLPNKHVEDLIREVQSAMEMEVTILPTDVFVATPPHGEFEEPVVDVSARSPIELLLAGLQSAGTWTTFLTYSLLSGVVVWIGLYSGTAYLLTAAMLLAPFAGPAINTAIATAAGRAPLLRHSVARYSAGVAVGALTAAVLTLLFRQSSPTELMVTLTSMSYLYVLLPLAAGAAGALYLVQSEHSSLVSGAAVGMLVAASLAPPTGILGAALALGTFDLAVRAAFLIVLQLVGINVVAAPVFRAYGVASDEERAGGGRPWMFPAVVGTCAVAFVLLTGAQLAAGDGWRQQDIAIASSQTISDAVSEVEGAELLDAVVRRARFSRSHLIADVTVRAPDADRARVTSAVADLLDRRLARDGVTVSVDLTVVAAR